MKFFREYVHKTIGTQVNTHFLKYLNIIIFLERVGIKVIAR